MFKASDLRRALDRMLDSPAATAAVMVVLLAMPVVASTRVAATETRDAPRSGAYQQAPEAPYNYQMRCWQHGRLVLERDLLELPADDHHPIRESGSDRHGHPVYVAEAGNATCLIRSVVDPGATPRP
jgi:hypothetical protein